MPLRNCQVQPPAVSDQLSQSTYGTLQKMGMPDSIFPVHLLPYILPVVEHGSFPCYGPGRVRMTTPDASRQMMYAQIVSQPGLILEMFETAEQCVRDTLAQFSVQHWRAIYTAGCGDSLYASLACEGAFARFCHMPVKALPAMQFSRYEVDNLVMPAVLFGISNSGNVSRSIEAVTMARDAGADTIAVTGNSTGNITREAHAVLALPILPMGRSPGIRSYTIQLLTLFLCALCLGEMRQVLSPAEADSWRQRLREVANCMEATIQANDALIKRLVERVHDEPDWVFVGAGPSYATALFCAAKLVESCGVHAWAQELEEWSHIQFFNRREHTPTCLILPPGRSVDRALELLPYIKGIGRYTLVVTHSEQPLLPTQVDIVLPVPQPVDEVFSPLVYCLAGELLAYYLAERKNSRFFCADRSGFSSGRDRLRESHTLRHLDELHVQTEGPNA
jgi:glucosamine--fructose-6-phosphate aminotransferase (isomerizing)